MLPFPSRFRFSCIRRSVQAIARLCVTYAVSWVYLILLQSPLNRTVNWLLKFVFVKFPSLFGASFYSVTQNAYAHTHTHTHTHTQPGPAQSTAFHNLFGT
jgi:hypothetical protein